MPIESELVHPAPKEQRQYGANQIAREHCVKHTHDTQPKRKHEHDGTKHNSDSCRHADNRVQCWPEGPAKLLEREPKNAANCDGQDSDSNDVGVLWGIE